MKSLEFFSFSDAIQESWDGFVKGSEFGDPMLFETMVFRAVPEFQASVEAKRAEKEQTE